MSCKNCEHPDARRVTLLDGREVCSWCEEWRHECEARTVLNFPSLRMRQEYLYGKMSRWGERTGGVKQKRGEQALKRLEDTMLELWNRRKNPANDNNQPHGGAHGSA